MNTYFYLIATFPDYYLIITRYIEKCGNMLLFMYKKCGNKQNIKIEKCGKEKENV